MTPAEFEEAGYDWDAIYSINHTEASSDFYVEGDALAASLRWVENTEIRGAQAREPFSRFGSLR